MATASSSALRTSNQISTGTIADIRARRVLKTAAITWLAVAVAGQLMMAIYVIGFYLSAVLDGGWARWNRLPVGLIEGDGVRNLILFSHLLFVTVVVVSSAIQLLPIIRRRWPHLHRWDGRLYIVAALVMGLGGLYLELSHKMPIGDLSLGIAISINALLILGFAAAALRYALVRDFDQHMRWALRLFLAMGGVWFFRIGLNFWLLINQGPVGFDPKTLTGPFVTFLSFAQYLLPLAVLELYFRARESHSVRGHLWMTACLRLAILVTATGIFATSMMMWLPRLSA